MQTVLTIVACGAVLFLELLQYFPCLDVTFKNKLIRKTTKSIIGLRCRPGHLINQLMQLCTARTAWSESDQAVRAVHGCNSR